MHEQIFVLSKAGQRCPKETRGMIYDHTPVQVPLTRFYQRMIAEGSLVRVDAPAGKAIDASSGGSLEVPVNVSEKRLKKGEAANDRK